MERAYYTQMEAARKNIITPEMEIVAKKEERSAEFIRERVAEGTVVIPANPKHGSLDANGIGSMLKTKINVNLGVSRDCKDYNVAYEDANRVAEHCCGRPYVRSHHRYQDERMGA